MAEGSRTWWIAPTITLTIIMLPVLFFSVAAPWFHPTSPVQVWFFEALFVVVGIIPFIGYLFLIPISVMLAAGAVFLFDRIRHNRFAVIGVLLLFALLLGFDEPLVNTTINRPTMTCDSDADCVRTQTSFGYCGTYRCANEDWTYYESLIRQVSGLSCVYQPIRCSCSENRCVTERDEGQFCDWIALSAQSRAGSDVWVEDDMIRAGVSINTHLRVSYRIMFIGTDGDIEEEHERSMHSIFISQPYDRETLGELEEVRVTPYFHTSEGELIVCEDQAISLYPE